ncbi:MAG: molecular chaperone DnaJ [Candidatus Nanopelagicaceae bacterium]|nr:molecular chaperone DnaJ [Candidatus Nanopelagicaceae bacterium]
MADLYEVLGVGRDATQDQIKRAYRKLVRELHPDVNPDPAVQDQFKEITAAYEVLSDTQKRQDYDHGGSSNGFGAFGFGDIMDAFFGGGGNRGPRPRVRAGQDALIRIEVDLNEACFGTEREITVESALSCNKCGGSGCAEGEKPQLCEICRGRGETQQITRSFIGQVMTSRPCANCQGYGSVIKNPCNECAGDGRVRTRQTITVKIPPGVETGNRIQMSGRGEVGPGGGPAGDLYVEIVQTPHEFLAREGDNLHVSLGITMVAAALGTTLTVESLDGPLPVAIKAGTQSGSAITVKGKGVTRLRGGGRGDLIVHVDVHTPTKLNKEQGELLSKFARLRGEKEGESQMQRHDGSFFNKFRDAFR